MFASNTTKSCLKMQAESPTVFERLIKISFGAVVVTNAVKNGHDEIVKYTLQFRK
jgi:hypothetical protein